MSSLRAFCLRFTGLFYKEQKDGELAEELESHLQMHIADNVRAGMSPAEARRDALIKLGGLDQTKERYRARRGIPFLESLLQDLRFGLRMLRKSPGFTAVAILTLALGIGANTAIFSIIDAVLLRPLPFRDPDRLVQLWETLLSPGNYPVNGLDFLDWRSNNHSFAGMTLYVSNARTYNLSGSGESAIARAINTDSNFFSVLGVEAQHGRTFASGEDQAGANHVVVLSDAYWRSQFGGNPEIVGKSIELDGEAFTVIGVMPPWFTFPANYLGATDIWVPWDMRPVVLGPRGEHDFSVIGRLKAGVSEATAQADLSAIAQRLEKENPITNEKVSAVVVSLKQGITQYSRPALLILLGVVTLVLLVACINVANLMLARASKRQREATLRAVLGASRWRVMRQMLTESVLLSMLGAASGLLLAKLAIQVFQSTENLPVPRIASGSLFDSLPLPGINPIHVDLRVLLFTISLSVVIGVLFGLAPALQVSRIHLGEDLKSGRHGTARSSGRRSHLHDALIVGELAISLALLVAAGLLLRSLANMRNADVGFQPKNIVTMRMTLPYAHYRDLSARRQFADALLDGLGRTPGIDKVSLAVRLPLEGLSNGYVAAGDSPLMSSMLVEWNYVTADYFESLHIPLLKGRTFTPAELDHAGLATTSIFWLQDDRPSGFTVPAELYSVAVINASMARLFWPDQDPIGKTFRMARVNGQQIRVVGVAGDVRARGIRDANAPEAYFPITEALSWHNSFFTLVAKGNLPPAQITAQVRKQVADLDSGIPVFHVRTMDEVISGSMLDMDVQATLLGIFAGLALILVTVGIYGVTAYLVTQRTPELGVRLALGARQRDILQLILGRGAKLTLIGLAAGILLALVLARVMFSLLFGVTSTDAGTYLVVGLFLGGVAMLACYIPARRAAKVDPMLALRYE